MLPEPTALAIFVSAALALLIAPGPAVLFIVARSLEQGRLAGIVSTLGIALGAIVHVCFAALGLSALLMQSALAFSLVKYAGAAYLIYLGIRTLRAPAPEATDIAVSRSSLPKLFRQGFVVNLLNPKTALFFFAFLPQFVSPERGPIAPQIIFLGGLFVVMALLSDSTYAVIAGTARQFLSRNKKVLQAQKTLAGVIYIALGVTTAFSGGDNR